MCFMNDFVGREIQNMKQFIDRISVSTTLYTPVNFQYISILVKLLIFCLHNSVYLCNF